MSIDTFPELEIASPSVAPRGLRCRGCGSASFQTFVDLGASPLANSYLDRAALDAMEPHYPLHALVCTECFLVGLQSFESAAAIFSDYAYFSSYSSSWLAHARDYVSSMMDRLSLGSHSNVVEIASNDGYLLQYFVERGVPVLGVEPATNIAAVAVERGIPTINTFFGEATARALVKANGLADLIVANNVLAHVPDIHDFVSGIATLLASTGVATFEFPHLLALIAETQFDTIYHEHFSYFSLLALEPIFARHGLSVIDAERLSTHGGSLRLHVGHRQNAKPADAVAALRRSEAAAGLDDLRTYHAFARRVREQKHELLLFLIDAARAGKQVVGYGAPAKGNTLLNACGIGPDLIPYTVDKSPHKQGRYLPGSRIPIAAPERIEETRPDYVLVLPWNLRTEIMHEMRGIAAWGGRFVIPIPHVTVVAATSSVARSDARS